MGFSLGRILEEKRIKHSTEDFFFFFFVADNYKPPVELISQQQGLEIRR